MRKDKLIVRGLACLLCLAMVAGFLPAGLLSVPVTVSAVENTTTNLVQNGDFEASDTEVTHWTGGPKSVAVGKGRDGSNALYIDDRTDGSNLEIKSEYIAVEEGVTYDFSAWAKLNDEFEGTTETVDAYVFWRDASDQSKGYIQVAFDAGEDWTQSTKSVTAPEGAVWAYLRLNVHKAPTLSAYVDDIVLSKAAVQYALTDEFELFNNGNAKEGPKGWVDSDPYNKTAVICEKNKYQGSYSLFFNEKNTWAKSPEFKVSAGYAYTVDFVAQKAQNNAVRTGYLEVVFLNADGDEIKTKEAKVGLYFGAWTQETVIAVAPEGAVKAYLLFGLESKLGAYGIDHLTVTKSDETATEDVETTDPSDEELNKIPVGITNGDFEKDLENWSAPASAEIVTEGAYAGKSVKLSTEGTALTLEQEIGVIPTKAYKLSVKAKRLSGTDVGYIGLWFYDENGATTPVGTAFTIQIANTDEWKEYTLIQAIPDDAVTVSVQLGNHSTKTMTYLIDEVKLEPYTGPDDQINLALPSGSGSSGPVELVDPNNLNFSFEELDKNGFPTVWRLGYSGIGSLKVVQPGDAPHGKNVLQVSKKDGYYNGSVRSGRIAVEPGKTYNVKVMGRSVDMEGKMPYVSLFMYDANGKAIGDASYSVAMQGSDQWKMYTILSVAPENAASMEMQVWYGSGAKQGSAQIDALVLGESEVVMEEPYVPTEYTYPTVDELLASVTDEYPRIYFTAEEAKQIKLRRFNTLKTKYGWTWNKQYEDLLALCEGYMEQTQVRVTSNTGKYVIIDISSGLLDPSSSEAKQIFMAVSYDDNGKLMDEPYVPFGGTYIERICEMLRYWSLAYIMTGKAMYAEHAISYAEQMCDWVGWGDYNWLTANGLCADACNAWAMNGIVTVFDMCHDKMTDAQIAKFKRAIIDKGLEPLSRRIDVMDTLNGNMMMVGAILSGSAAILDKNNAEEIYPYLCKGLLATHNALDIYAYSGNTEGHYYTDFGLETFITGLGHMYRATKMEGLIDHYFFTDILPYWTVMWAASNNGHHPSYSDSSYKAYMKLPMAVLSKLTSNSLIDGFLINAGGTGDVFNDLAYLNPEPNPTYLTDYAGVIEVLGYGALRTGFADDDMMLTLKANNSQMGHNHYDQNSIQLNLGGNWLIQDPGSGSYYKSDRSFWTHSGHSTILVDDMAQQILGYGSTELVFNNNLYSYIKGSAPDAYGSDFDSKMLTKFDRHAIQINHEDKPYYVIIDDLAAPKDRVYTWQMYNGARQQVAVDGEDLPPLGSADGNSVTMPLAKNILNLNFIDSDKLKIEDKLYTSSGEGAGAAVTASTAASKAHQFMTVISTDTNINANYISFAGILNGQRFTSPDHIVEGEISWDSSMPLGQECVKPTTLHTMDSVFFRGNKVGDWIEIPFTIEETGDYEFSLWIGISDGACTTKISLDGTELETVDCSGIGTPPQEHKYGEMHLEAGEHKIRYEIADKGYHEAYEPGWYLVYAVGIDLMRVGVEVPETKDLVVTEVIDNEQTLAGMINYIDNKYDFLMWNRTEGAVTAGALNTDGQQASVLGLVDGKVTEGFAVTGATTMTYDGKVLFLAEKKVDIVASNTGWQVIADEAQTVQLTAIAPELDYVVTVNGEAVDARIENGILTVALAEGENAIVVDVDEPEPTDPTKPTEPDESEPEPTEPTENKGGDATVWIIIGVIAALVLAGAAVGIVLFVKKRKGTDAPAAE